MKAICVLVFYRKQGELQRYLLLIVSRVSPSIFPLTSDTVFPLSLSSSKTGETEGHRHNFTVVGFTVVNQKKVSLRFLD